MSGHHERLQEANVKDADRIRLIPVEIVKIMEASSSAEQATVSLFPAFVGGLFAVSLACKHAFPLTICPCLHHMCDNKQGVMKQSEETDPWRKHMIRPNAVVMSV